MFGRGAVEKARRCGEIVRQRLASAGMEPARYHVECIGDGAVTGIGGLSSSGELMETMLRISVADERREVVEKFAREMAPLVTSGPPGTTGYAEGRPPVREVYGYWPTLIPRERVTMKVEVCSVGLQMDADGAFEEIAAKKRKRHKK